MGYYTASKTKDGEYWYAHRVGYPNIPVLGSFCKTRKGAYQHCANLMAMFLDQYMDVRKRHPEKFKGG